MIQVEQTKPKVEAPLNETEENQPRQNTAVDWKAALLAAFFPIWYLVISLVGEMRAKGTPYFLTEYMVTYSGGFVRRGLLGQIFLSVSDYTGIPPLSLIFGVRLVLALAYASAFAWLCYRNREALGRGGMVLVLASPLTGLFLWFDLGPVDLLFLLITFAHLLVGKDAGARYVTRAAILFGTIGTLICLSHEAFLFLCLPVNVAISLRKVGVSRAKELLKIYLIPLVAFLLATKFRGTPEQVDAITKAWEAKGVILTKPNAVQLLPADAVGQIAYMRRLITPVSLAVWAAAAVGCVGPLVYLCHKTFQVGPQRAWLGERFWAYLGIPLFCTLPLYPIGNDWHRWLAIPFAAATFCFLADGLPRNPRQSFAKSVPMVGLLVLLELFVVPTSLYFPTGSAVGGPLMVTLHFIRHALIHR